MSHSSTLLTLAESLQTTINDDGYVAAWRNSAAMVEALETAETWLESSLPPETRGGETVAQLERARCIVPHASLTEIWQKACASLPDDQLLRPDSFLERYGAETLSPELVAQFEAELQEAVVPVEDWESRITALRAEIDSLEARVLIRAALLPITAMAGLARSPNSEDVRHLRPEFERLHALVKSLDHPARLAAWRDLSATIAQLTQTPFQTL